MRVFGWAAQGARLSPPPSSALRGSGRFRSSTLASRPRHENPGASRRGGGWITFQGTGAAPPTIEVSGSTKRASSWAHERQVSTAQTGAGTRGTRNGPATDDATLACLRAMSLMTPRSLRARGRVEISCHGAELLLVLRCCRGVAMTTTLAVAVGSSDWMVTVMRPPQSASCASGLARP